MHAGDFGSELRLIRLALERTSETLKAENVESSSDTVYVRTPTMVQPPPVMTAATRSSEALAPGANLADANLHRGPIVLPAAVAHQFTTWVALAAVVVAAVLGTIVMMQRPSGPAAAAATSASGRDPAVSTASTSEGMVKLVLDPDGAAVTITATPPASLRRPKSRIVTSKARRCSSRRAASVRMSSARAKRRFGAASCRCGSRPVGRPPRCRRPRPLQDHRRLPATLSVTLKGSYPFEVVDGARVIGESGTEHTLTLAGPRVLRLRNSEYMLDYSVRVDASRTSANVPDLEA